MLQQRVRKTHRIFHRLTGALRAILQHRMGGIAKQGRRPKRHFSIGSGTRLAIEDAIALAKALEAEAHVATAPTRYQAERQPIVKKLVTASARTSADWYEKFVQL
jgi:hypothetical protein